MHPGEKRWNFIGGCSGIKLDSHAIVNSVASSTAFSWIFSSVILCSTNVRHLGELFTMTTYFGAKRPINQGLP